MAPVVPVAPVADVPAPEVLVEYLTPDEVPNEEVEPCP